MIWLQFSVAVVFAIACLLGPGYLVARALRVQGELALAVAPLISVAAYCLLAVVYGFAGISCGWLTLPALLFVAGGIALGLAKRHGCGTNLFLCGASSRPLAERGLFSHVSAVRLGMALGAAIALGTALVVYVSVLGSPDSFIQFYDNSFHLTRIHEFADSGNYSSLSGTFYPSAWHLVAALAESTVGISSGAAEHVANLAFIVAVYPLGMVALMGALFPQKPRVVWLTGLFCLAVAFWPWRIMLFGPLYPNLAAYCLMPAEAAIFISFFDSFMGERPQVKVTLFVLGGMALGFAQPNGIFSTGVFLIPFCLYEVRHQVKDRLGAGGRSLFLSILAEVGLALFFAGAWLVLTQLPVMQGTVYYPRPPIMFLKQAVKWAFNFSYVLYRPQFAMTLAVFIGIFVLIRVRDRRWLILSYLFATFLYVVAVSVRGEWKYFISGFWYSDYYRLAAAATIFAVPLISCGIDALISGLIKIVSYVGRKTLSDKGFVIASVAVPAVAVSLLMAFNYVPWEFTGWAYLSYGFDAIRWEMNDSYQNDSAHILDQQERLFLVEVKDIVGDAKVANMCYDGSGFAYATDDIHVLSSLFGMTSSDEVELLKRRINRYTEDPLVAEAVWQEGVEYVLQLDHGSTNGSLSFGGTVNLMCYSKAEWLGVMLVDENTPGFELVLSEGDMRLYRLTEL